MDGDPQGMISKFADD